MAYYRVNYRHLANRLSELVLHSTCADLAASLAAYEAIDAGLKEKLLAAVSRCESGDEWLEGLYAICEVLKEDNPRFLPHLFIEWATEEI